MEVNFLYKYFVVYFLLLLVLDRMIQLKKNANRKTHTRLEIFEDVFIMVFTVLVGFFVTTSSKFNMEKNYEETIEFSGNAGIFPAEDIFDVVSKIEEAVKVKPIISKLNKEQTIHNTDVYGPADQRTSIIVVTVRNKIFYLNQLISCLQNVTEIHDSLIIFAHSVYDEGANIIIEERVTFSRYMQIFYPYSAQMYPTMFPGPDKKFCLESYKCVSDIERNFTLAEDKHFWWWKMNFIFDNLHEIQLKTEYVMFIDEDNYVLEDFIHVYKKYIKELPSHCNMICLGCHSADLKNYNVFDEPSIIEEFGTTKYGMALAFNKVAWNRIKRLRGYFCRYNDYSWYESLRYLESISPKGSFMVLSSEGPRVLQMGKCYHSYVLDECTLRDSLEEIALFVKLVKRNLYPRKLNTKSVDTLNQTKLERSGYFDDARDQDLCLYMSKRHKYRLF